VSGYSTDAANAPQGHCPWLCMAAATEPHWGFSKPSGHGQTFTVSITLARSTANTSSSPVPPGSRQLKRLQVIEQGHDALVRRPLGGGGGSPAQVMARVLNALPHTGISRETCGALSSDQGPLITSHIGFCGNLLPWCRSIRVKLDDVLSKKECLRPTYLTDAPKQLAQLSLKCLRPKPTEFCAHEAAVMLSMLTTTRRQMVCLFKWAPGVLCEPHDRENARCLVCAGMPKR